MSLIGGRAGARASAAPTTSTDALARLSAAVKAAVVVREETLRLALVALLARGHILLEDLPGVGKTLMARTLAQAVGGEFRRGEFPPPPPPPPIPPAPSLPPQTTRVPSPPRP